MTTTTADGWIDLGVGWKCRYETDPEEIERLRQRTERSTHNRLEFDARRQEFLREGEDRWCAVADGKAYSSDTLHGIIAELDSHAVSRGTAFVKYLTTKRSEHWHYVPE